MARHGWIEGNAAGFGALGLAKMRPGLELEGELRLGLEWMSCGWLEACETRLGTTGLKE